MLCEQFRTGGCLSYVVACEETRAAALIDAEASQLDRYRAFASQQGLRIHYVIDTHTHADHFSGSRAMARALDVPIVMHRASRAASIGMRVDDGELVVLGRERLLVHYTPGHTIDSMTLEAGGRLFTGDTLLIGGTGRTDLPTGDPDALYDSLFGKLLLRDPALEVCPAHDYKGRSTSRLALEVASNPRLQQKSRAAFVALMRALDIEAPRHLTEALRTNLSGGKTVSQLLADASEKVPFMAMDQLRARIARGDNDILLLDVRERDAYDAGHLPGAMHLPRGQLELRVNAMFPDPGRRIVVYCELGLISTLAAATLKDLGFERAVALDGGAKAWREAGYELERTAGETGRAPTDGA
jgi:glyoxylase-like metal-dependent hydrolase (beta-lactamase superfamily II)/rhodanese-related sulfurtransferase